MANIALPCSGSLHRRLLNPFTIVALTIICVTLPDSLPTAAADEKPADEKPADEKKADEKKADEKKADEKKADEKKADEKKADEKKAESESEPASEVDEEKLPEGHSYHGEAFNEGPRQHAYLIPGTGNVEFPVTTKNPEVQKFINQGVGQLHGFWYFEAERSFRQAAFLDPDCAIAYWGMAMANGRNAERARAFIKEAVDRKQHAGEREVKYIDALNNYWKEDKRTKVSDADKKKKRYQDYTKALERICYAYPDDLEAKAFLGLQLWSNRSGGIPISSHLAIDALHKEILAKNPLHPCHHYRIHLWDYEKAEFALNSAAQCGQSAPAIAHMWHMPGHIYSRLKRYQDAAWQQEASARVDHAQMIRDRILPDQIHNFAHNNEWLIRNLIFLGRANDAIDLAKNMIELPRHPKYNTLKKRGSTNYGRRRLFGALSQFEQWEQLIELCDSTYLEPTEDAAEQINRLRHLGRASFHANQTERGEQALQELRERLEQQNAKQQAAVEKAETKAKDEKKDDKATKSAVDAAKKPFRTLISTLERAIHEIEGLQAVQAEDYKAAYGLLKKAGGIDAIYLARIQHLSGDTDKAIAAAEKHVKSHKSEVLPLAGLVSLLAEADKHEQAKQRFDELRAVAAHADLDLPALQRLRPLADKFDWPADWRQKSEPATDVGDRPDLESLGPFRWSPYQAEEWTLTDHQSQTYSLKQYAGKPVVVIFYLGFGCLHCAEQLQSFAPHTEKFRDAGIELIAISTDDVDKLIKSHENYRDGEFPFPLVSDAKLEVFRKYRVYDDFESIPLHGTFLIDGQGLVRWQDISYEPFNEPEFVLEEAQRLLGHSNPQLAKTVAADSDEVLIPTDTDEE